jgi:taurine dioxygenase
MSMAGESRDESVRSRHPYPRPQAQVRPCEPYRIGRVQVHPAHAPLGAEIRGLDLTAPVTDADLDALREAWADHLVLLWRGVELSVDDHLRIGHLFGALDDMSHVAVESGLPKEMLVIENNPALNQALDTAPENYRQGFQAKLVRWHTDNSYRPVPPRGSLFYMRVAPPAGGVTGFANMYEAYNELPEDLRLAVQGRWAKHDSSLNSGGTLRVGRTPPTDVSRGDGVEHPLARVHPLTGRVALYLGRRPYQYVCGLPVAESETLLDGLWEHAVQDRFVWQRTEQRAGDLILWDNRCAMHSRDWFDPRHRRLAHRVQMTGEPVVARWPRIDG